MLLFPEPLDGLTVSQEAEEEIVQFPLAKTEMNWLPASPSTLWVLMAIDGGSTGSSLTGSLHEKAISDSAISAATDVLKYAIRTLKRLLYFDTRKVKLTSCRRSI